MKRPPQSHNFTLRTSVCRRGVALVWVMVYLSLTTMLLALSGTTLHMVFTALRMDQQSENDLNLLRDLDVALRRDAAAASRIRLTNGALEFHGDATVVWSADQHTIIRTERRNAEPASRGVRRFRRGTQFRITREGDSFVAVQMFPPLPGQRTDVSATRTVADEDRRVEILLAVPVTDPDAADTAEAPVE